MLRASGYRPAIGFVWLCFFAAQKRQFLHNTLLQLMLRLFDPFANWLCFAQFVNNFAQNLAYITVSRPQEHAAPRLLTFAFLLLPSALCLCLATYDLCLVQPFALFILLSCYAVSSILYSFTVYYIIFGILFQVKSCTQTQIYTD